METRVLTFNHARPPTPSERKPVTSPVAPFLISRVHLSMQPCKRNFARYTSSEIALLVRLSPYGSIISVYYFLFHN